MAFLFPGQGSQAVGMLQVGAMHQACFCQAARALACSSGAALTCSLADLLLLQGCKDIPAVKAMLATAQGVLGYDLLKVCLEGPKELLDDTAVSQPALYVAGLAAVEQLRAEDAAAVDQCSAAAGLNLGEYCALVFAGALSFEDGLKVRRTCRSLAGSICCT